MEQTKPESKEVDIDITKEEFVKKYTVPYKEDSRDICKTCGKVNVLSKLEKDCIVILPHKPHLLFSFCKEKCRRKFESRKLKDATSDIEGSANLQKHYPDWKTVRYYFILVNNFSKLCSPWPLMEPKPLN